MDVFNKLLKTIKEHSVNNQVTITNVDLFIKSWKKEYEISQLRKEDVNVSFYCFERHIETGNCKKQCKECKKYENN